MNTTHATAPMHSPSVRMPPVLLGGLAVGTFDLIFACTWWAIAAHVPPIRIFQSIGAGWYGDASFEGGMRTAAVGVLSHYVIATCMVLAFALIAARKPPLMRNPWRWGTFYGALLYIAMNYVIVPLSAASPGPKKPAWMIASIVVHVLIGIACAFIARRAVRNQ